VRAQAPTQALHLSVAGFGRNQALNLTAALFFGSRAHNVVAAAAAS
jgi:hypothetical protein